MLIGRAWIDWDGATTTTLGSLINTAFHATWSGHVSQGQTNLYGEDKLSDNTGSFQTDTINFLGISTWSGAGGDGNWSTGSNWNTAPINGVALAFAGSATSPAPNNDNDLTSVNFIKFNSGAGSFNVGGS